MQEIEQQEIEQIESGIIDLTMVLSLIDQARTVIETAGSSSTKERVILHLIQSKENIVKYNEGRADKEMDFIDMTNAVYVTIEAFLYFL
ncbi:MULTISPECIES: hypothetical protein [Xanthocytophaga]|uniref:Uncharacterized protein n=1 Tax=Xanthocytophaga flava TaxID=3048013 RepID=A0AAE3QZP3_9BACT|nr:MULTISPECIES: hypothetical protein [Xanthocytophaga]MDJ1486161.1 hypothetical protein [Xanthocytophaga flavus]